MKRFLILLVFLALLGATIFYFGWIQLRIPAGAHAVVFSRTDGWEEHAIPAGTFAWRWQPLLPTNLSLYVFETTEHETRVSTTGSLPSAAVYEAVAPAAGGFDYTITIDVISRLRVEMLPQLARDRDLRPDGLDEFHGRVDSIIKQNALDAVATLLRTPDDALETDAFERVAAAISTRLIDRVPEIEVVSIVPREIRLPDMDLYRETRTLAREVSRARTDALIRAADDLAAATVSRDQEFGLLERYGQVLDRYPVLLDYFRLGQEISGDPLNIQSLVQPARP